MFVLYIWVRRALLTNKQTNKQEAVLGCCIFCVPVLSLSLLLYIEYGNRLVVLRRFVRKQPDLEKRRPARVTPSKRRFQKKGKVLWRASFPPPRSQGSWSGVWTGVCERGGGGMPDVLFCFNYQRAKTVSRSSNAVLVRTQGVRGKVGRLRSPGAAMKTTVSTTVKGRLRGEGSRGDRKWSQLSTVAESPNITPQSLPRAGGVDPFHLETVAHVSETLPPRSSRREFRGETRIVDGARPGEGETLLLPVRIEGGCRERAEGRQVWNPFARPKLGVDKKPHDKSSDTDELFLALPPLMTLELS